MGVSVRIGASARGYGAMERKVAAVVGTKMWVCIEDVGTPVVAVTGIVVVRGVPEALDGGVGAGT